MDNVIEYRPAKRLADLNALLVEQINVLINKGWRISVDGDCFRLKMAGRPDKVVRNGVINHG